jgi:hypothetical protein
MNSEQVQSLVRTVLSVLGTFLVSKGLVGTADWTTIAGAVVMLAPVAWSMYAHTDTSALKVVAAMPDVAKIVAVPGASDGVAAAAKNPDMPKVVAAAAAALLFGFLILQSAPAFAQTAPRVHAPTGNVVQDVRDLTSGGVIASAIEAKQGSDISTFLTNLADISGAITLSTQIPGLQDPVGNACWQQFGPIGDLMKAHPLVLSGKAASDIEGLRLLAIGLNQICANPNCGQMFVDATNAVTALAAVPLPISLQSLCAKVPVIGTSAVPTVVVPTAGIGTVPAK